jgi:hypothetical protein
MVSEHSDGNTAYAVYPDGHVEEFGFDPENPTSLDAIERTVNASALSNAKNAYAAAQAYFADHPDGSVSLNAISRYGFRQTEVVSVSPGGTRNTLTIVTYHPAGDRTYTVTSDGSISNN